MELLVNELSVHGQFHDGASFRDALSQLMAIRGTAGRFGWKVQCHREFLSAKPMPDTPMQQAIGRLGLAVEERRAVMSWLSKAGPFWDDVRRHGGDDWLECDSKIVTDTAVGEAAFRTLHGVNCGLVSFSPSAWERTPVEVTWRRKAEELDDRSANLENWWNATVLKETLHKKAPPICSWDDLRKVSGNRFKSLTFAADCFVPLKGVPFAKSAAERFCVLLNTLDRLARAFDAAGERTAEGHRICQDHFMGDQTWFSDSSDSEKQKFRQGLTFKHPGNPESTLFCTWHGKASYSTLRLHFSWPIEAGKPVYIVYAGPKITKQ